MNFQVKPPDLTECDREPIHQIGTVQPFGGLVAINSDWVIAHVSANCARLLDTDDPPRVGAPLASAFQPHAIDSLKTALSRIAEDDTVERVFGLRLIQGGTLFDCAIHPMGSRIIIEFEPHDETDYDNHLAMIAPLLGKLSGAKDISTLCARTASLVREMLGYDRVMIYRFHRDNSGEVIAEDRRDDMEPFIGLRYPQSDIPAQARELFRRNRFRVIADIDAEPAGIEPAVSADGAPLDLSMSVLRSSSPIHLQYLRNMGVAASLTIAIVRQGRLWGLISCHHNTPKLVPFSLRTVAEMFSQMFSLMLDRLLIERSETLRQRGRHLHDQMMLRFAGGGSVTKDLGMLEDVLGDLIAHDGTSVMIQDEYRSRGDAPNEAQFLAIVPALGAAPTSTVLATPALAEQVPVASVFADVAAGALVLPISRSPRDYLVLWRKPLTQTVRWAGNPAKAVQPGKDRLEPRSSFAEWAQTVEGRSDDWSEDEVMIAEGLRITLLEVILRMTDEVSRERKRAQEQQDLLIAELNHRVRNILNLIKGLVSQSSKGAVSVADFASIIGGRIAALATAHDNITRENWAPAPLASLFKTELEAYLSDKRSRLRMTEDSVLIRPEAYTVLALVVHELVTNSAKYGALCDSRGSIDIEIDRAKNGDLMILWRERGGPPVKPPTRRGFGSTIIMRSIPYELRGEADLRFKLSGLEAEFRIPARYVAVMSDAERQSLGQFDPGAAVAQGKLNASVPDHVLVVEDNMIIALDTEDCLLEMGVKSVKVEGTVAGALEAIEERLPDFAIVDYNLGVESSVEVAEELARRGVRYVLATGYSELASDIDDLGAAGLVRKPYGAAEIEQAMFGQPGQ